MAYAAKGRHRGGQQLAASLALALRGPDLRVTPRRHFGGRGPPIPSHSVSELRRHSTSIIVESKLALDTHLDIMSHAPHRSNLSFIGYCNQRNPPTPKIEVAISVKLL